MLDLSHEPDLGFIFHPPETPDHPGHPRLDVFFREKPTGRHYDPEHAEFRVISLRNDIEHIIIHHPWTTGDSYRVCPGRVVLTDRKGKRVEAFTFGGELQVAADAKQTVCALESAVPIFPLFTTHDLPMWIVGEVEGLLARQNAHWDPEHPHTFETHLAAVDPMLLYASCLQALQERAEQFDDHPAELAHQGLHFVENEIQRLQEQGAWPMLLPTLDQLL